MQSTLNIQEAWQREMYATNTDYLGTYRYPQMRIESPLLLCPSSKHLHPRSPIPPLLTSSSSTTSPPRNYSPPHARSTTSNAPRTLLSPSTFPLPCCAPRGLRLATFHDVSPQNNTTNETRHHRAAPMLQDCCRARQPGKRATQPPSATQATHATRDRMETIERGEQAAKATLHRSADWACCADAVARGWETETETRKSAEVRWG